MFYENSEVVETDYSNVSRIAPCLCMVSRVGTSVNSSEEGSFVVMLQQLVSRPHDCVWLVEVSAWPFTYEALLFQTEKISGRTSTIHWRNSMHKDCVV
jgi:hypothetical protein